MSKPNILYIHSHDTGRYIQPYGHPVATPNLQRFAEQGVLFRQAFCGNPTCSPSRACLLTGQYAHSNGMLGLSHLGMQLKDRSQHLAHFLAGNGYRTTLCGVSHVNWPPEKRSELGYQEILPLEGRGGIAIAGAAHLKAGPEGPWFMSCGFQDTHREFPAKLEDNPDYCIPPPYFPDTPEARLDTAQYKASARHLDRDIGMILDALDASGQADNTLVIVTTDHGIAFPRMKCHLYDWGMGVMLMMRGPGGFAGGRITDSLVSQIDLYPTICEVAGLTPPPWLQGVSLTPLAANCAASVREEVFAEVNYHVSYEPVRGVRTARYKYIRRYGKRPAPVLPNTDDGPIKDMWMAAGYPDFEDEELFDLMFDPNEKANLVGRADAAPILADMRARLQRWQEATDDPILKGPVAPWPEATLLSVNGVSPKIEPKVPWRELGPNLGFPV